MFLVFGMAFALSYFQNSSVNALDGSYDDAIMGQSSHIDQDENKIEDAKEEKVAYGWLNPHDAAVSGDQGRISGLYPVLPHRRLLRDVL